jgi:hypothetical protein
MYVMRIAAATTAAAIATAALIVFDRVNSVDSGMTLSAYVPWMIGAIVLCVSLIVTVTGKGVRIEVFDDGKLRYYKRGVLKKELDLRSCSVYDIGAGGMLGSSKGLGIKRGDGESDVVIDCSLIGIGKFRELYDVALKLSEDNT